MATIYQKTVTDKTCILSPREYFMRPFDFGAWTEMRLGFFMGGVASSGDNTDSSSEILVTSTVADKIAIGIKNSDTAALPGEASSLFVGILSFNANASCDANLFGTNNGNTLAKGAYASTSLIGGTTGDAFALQFPNSSPSSSYCGFWAIKYVINNLGLSTQSIDVSTTKSNTVSGTDYSASALRTLINNGGSNTWDTPTTLAWNTGAAARAIPDAVFVRLPFFSNRIRLSCMRAIRYAP